MSDAPKQPTPGVNAEDVRRISRRDFGTEREGEILAILEDYGKQDYQREVPRVRMAILKLANGDLETLRHMTNAACGDYRDVLSWAEYERYAKISLSNWLSSKDAAKAMQEDWQEYQAWLHRP